MVRDCAMPCGDLSMEKEGRGEVDGGKVKGDFTLKRPIRI